MSVTMEEVLSFLDPEEPNYDAASAALGADALPHLESLASGQDELRAAKAIWLASLIGDAGALPLLASAATSLSDEVRVASAAAARNIADSALGELIPTLLGDSDPGVRRLALAAVDQITEPMRPALERLLEEESHGELRLAAGNLLGLPVEEPT